MTWRELPTETRDWSEEDWERFFKHEDERHFTELQAHSSQVTTPDDELSFGENSEYLFGAEPDLSNDDNDYDEDFDQELNRIPAWRAAVDFCDRAIEVLSPLCEEKRGGPRYHLASTLVTECYLVPEYVLAGHELGYDEDTLCGNIALCSRAHSALERCIQCLERLGRDNDENIPRLIVRAIIARVFVERRISDLRTEVWWR